MKILIYLALAGMFITSCSVFQMSQKQKQEFNNFSVKGKTVYYKDKPMAILQKITYSKENENVVKEMNFSFVGDKSQEHMTTMINFLSYRHQDSEIEVEIDIQNEQITL